MEYYLPLGVGALNLPGGGHPVIGLIEPTRLGWQHGDDAVEGPVTKVTFGYAEPAAPHDAVVADLHNVAEALDLLYHYLQVLQYKQLRL